MAAIMEFSSTKAPGLHSRWQERSEGLTPEQIVLAKKARLDFDNRLEEYNNYGPNDELVGEILDIACNLKDWLCHALDALETHQSEIAQARREALLEATRAVCHYCKEEAEGVENRHLWIWYDQNYVHGLDPRGMPDDTYYGGYDDCDASAIHQLLATNQSPN